MSRPGSTHRAELAGHLVETAARLLAEQGPRALTARALARETGASTMAVYTHFGGMPGVVRAVIHEGFARLADRLAAVPETADPVADSYLFAAAYRRSALADPHLYAVMFGGSTVAGFALSEEDRTIGRYTLRMARDSVARCVDAGRYRSVEPWSMARQQWCHLHGLVTLENAGFLPAGAAGSTDHEFRRHLRDFAVGAGDTIERATASLAVLDRPADDERSAPGGCP
ncbi:TetR/AcrR family transcriptional regulator [Plantactinospora sp. GCM10030261]|uniref:TetR/AcrR family transcriptional regulator n=1 Tax=Plantactinospora sp. GCM10030261 TaxID=3273420 RepID=UPI0036209DBE